MFFVLLMHSDFLQQHDTSISVTNIHGHLQQLRHHQQFTPGRRTTITSSTIETVQSIRETDTIDIGDGLYLPVNKVPERLVTNDGIYFTERKKPQTKQQQQETSPALPGTNPPLSSTEGKINETQKHKPRRNPAFAKLKYSSFARQTNDNNGNPKVPTGIAAQRRDTNWNYITKERQQRFEHEQLANVYLPQILQKKSKELPNGAGDGDDDDDEEEEKDDDEDDEEEKDDDDDEEEGKDDDEENDDDESDSVDVVAESDVDHQNPVREDLENQFSDGENENMALAAASSTLPFKPAVPYLGVLVDAGRHYFPIPWLEKLIDRLSDMHYNLIHLRLTDDQAFNVNLTSYPGLAYPTATTENQGTRKVYEADELRRINAYAKSKGISIMPEINVPGHAGAWAGIPGLVVQCPKFACHKGYGIPLNISHPQIDQILTNVIREVIDIFDDPPFLHLGGDEVHMSHPCFHEAGVPVFNYTVFEQQLQNILKEVNYPEERVVRWEVTKNWPGKLYEPNPYRAGHVEHFWESWPGDRHNASNQLYFVSNQLYLDVNNDEDAAKIYANAHQNMHLKHNHYPTAVIVGTFELSPEFWFDRNVLGRLLAVAMGVSNITLDGVSYDGDVTTFPLFVVNNEKVRRISSSVHSKYKELCVRLGFGDTICDKGGRPVIPTFQYQTKWRRGWQRWKEDTCSRISKL